MSSRTTSAAAGMQVLTVVFVGLSTNLLLAVALAPFLLVALAPAPLASWPLLLLTAPLVAPALTGAFEVFRAFSSEGSLSPVRSFWRGWRGGLPGSLAVGAATTAVVAVLAVDMAAVWGHRAGALAIPFFAVVGAFAVRTALLVLLAGQVSGAPASPWRRLVVCAALGVRRWPLGLLTLAVLALLLSAVTLQPVLGLGLAAAPLLYVVWADDRFVLRPLEEVHGAPAEPRVLARA